MQCAACGAKMLLIGVVLADIATMPGFERHTFKCSSCPQTARRLAICRAKMALVEPLPPIAASQTPASNLRTVPPATSSSQPNAAEKLHSTQARRTEGHRLEANGREAGPGSQGTSGGSEGLSLG
jgi:hypothetical protein